MSAAAETASCHPNTLHAAIAAGTLEATRAFGAGPYLISPEALQRWAAQRTGPSANGGTGALAVKGNIRRGARSTDPDDASLSPALLAGVLGLLLEDEANQGPGGAGDQ